MQELYQKYAILLLKKGLCIKKNQPLVIHAPIDSIKFIRIFAEEACKLGVNDIYYDWYDEELEHTSLKYYNESKIKKSSFWNKTWHDEYANKDAAFIYLVSADTNIMQDISSSKLKVANKQSINTKKVYRKLQNNNKINWCIAAVATEKWGKILFPESKNPLEKLWNLIFDICLIKEENPSLAWKNKMNNNKKKCNYLTNLNIKSLHYQNKLGTDLYIELPEKAIWCGGSSKIKNKELIVNIPTEEVFTTPNKYKTNGIVYTNMPLVHSGILIEDICLEFKEGRVIKYTSKTGLEELKNIIEFDAESNMLGECALVDNQNKISKTNILFYETLFDENASCHIALGRGFKECIKNGENLSSQKLENIGYNKSKNHIDIMIGTSDLTITAKTYDNKEIVIFKEGKFNI